MPFSPFIQKNAINLFEDRKVRTVWDDKEEKWFFCVVDVVEALTDSVNPSDYIKKMKKRDPELAKGWGQIVTPPFYTNSRREAKGKLCYTRRAIPYHSVHSFP